MSVTPFSGRVATSQYYKKGRYRRQALVYRPVTYSQVKRWRDSCIFTYAATAWKGSGFFTSGGVFMVGLEGNIIFKYDPMGTETQMKNPGIARQSDRLKVLGWNYSLTVNNGFGMAANVRVIKFKNTNPQEQLTWTQVNSYPNSRFFTAKLSPNLFRKYTDRSPDAVSGIIDLAKDQEFNYDLVKNPADLYCDRSLLVSPFHSAPANDSSDISVGSLYCPEWRKQYLQYEMQMQSSGYPGNFHVTTSPFYVFAIVSFERNIFDSLPDEAEFTLRARSEVVYYDL